MSPDLCYIAAVYWYMMLLPFIFIFIFIIYFFFSCICITISSDYFFYIGDQFIEPYGFSGSLPLLFAVFCFNCGK